MTQGTFDSARGLRAGAAQVEITPPAGTHLAGSIGVHRAAQSVSDPLYAKALVLECGGRRICLLALDVTIITRPWTEKIRSAAAEMGFAHDAVMVHAIQTHSAPPIGHFMLDEDFEGVPAEFEWLWGGETAFYESATARAIEAIRAANASLEPVQLGVGSAIKDGLAWNRRGIMRDGKACMPWIYSSLQQPLGPTHIRYMEGPVDPEVGVMCLRKADGRMLAMVLHYTCHPVNVFATPPGLVVSADWPGAWAADIRSMYGDGCVPLVINGCCGNINPWPPFEPDFVPDHRRMGRELTETARRVIGQLAFRGDAALDWRIRDVPLPIREVGPEASEAARKVLAEHPQPQWSNDARHGVTGEWMSAALTLSVHLMRRREPELAYEIQVLRIGDTAIVGLPGEPFVEGQLAIKIESPAYPTYVAHCTTQYVGYLPTREAFQRGGHEVNLSYWAKVGPEALDLVVENAVGLIKEVFGG
jgi:neutral ceramidase